MPPLYGGGGIIISTSMQTGQQYLGQNLLFRPAVLLCHRISHGVCTNEQCVPVVSTKHHTGHLMTYTEWHTLSLRFNGHFPGGPGLAGTRMSPFWILLELRMMEVVSGDNWSSKTLQSKCHHKQTNTQFFFTDWMPFLPPNQQCQSTEGKNEIKFKTKPKMNPAS